jgi:hypothetical protein
MIAAHLSPTLQPKSEKIWLYPLDNREEGLILSSFHVKF